MGASVCNENQPVDIPKFLKAAPSKKGRIPWYGKYLSGPELLLQLSEIKRSSYFPSFSLFSLVLCICDVILGVCGRCTYHLTGNLTIQNVQCFELMGQVSKMFMYLSLAPSIVTLCERQKGVDWKTSWWLSSNLNFTNLNKWKCRRTDRQKNLLFVIWDVFEVQNLMRYCRPMLGIMAPELQQMWDWHLWIIVPSKLCDTWCI